MPFFVNVSLLFAICLGQAMAFRWGRVAAVVYFLCVFPLNSLGVWYYAGWFPGNLCALILIVGGFFVHRVPTSGALVWRPWLFFAYLAATTLLGMQFWPIESMASISIVYQEFRGLVQLVNWGLRLGVAWQIALAMSVPGAFRKMQPYVLNVGTVLCLYAVYQMFAYNLGLPATAIGRGMAAATGTMESQQRAAFKIEGETVYRPGSLVGEPKDLGSLIVFWFAVLLAGRLGQRFRIIDWVRLGVFVLSLLLTASTSAWCSTIGILLLAFYAYLRMGGMLGLSRRVIAVAAALVAAIFLMTVFGYPVFREVVTTRLVKRMHDPLVDLPVVTTMEVLSERPYLAVFGTGCGGMSFYIAERLGGDCKLILFPNVGYLGLVSDIGVVGILLAFLLVAPGVFVYLRAGRRQLPAMAVAYVGVAIFSQVFVYEFFHSWSVLFGFLWAAEVRAREIWRHVEGGGQG